MMFLTVPLFLIAATAFASPTPASNPPLNTVTAQTGFTHYVSCTQKQKDILNQNVKDAVALASAGLDYINDELATQTYPQYAHRQVDFSKQAAIDFFGPESKNAPYQQHIFDTLYKAANAYPGWGIQDWWKDRYVTLSCLDHAGDCVGGKYAAYFDRVNHDYGYPLVVFCNEFFTKLASHDDAVKRIDQNPELQQNVANLRSRATTFLHELLHINWGTAQECEGPNACLDHWQDIGGKLEPSYKSGRTKLLAQRDAETAAWNNDNYAYYAMVKFMEKRWKKYPKYPAMWDPKKSRAENEDREKKEPGATSVINDFEESTVYDQGRNGPAIKGPIYPASAYPDWYQPMMKTSFNDRTPDLHQPTDNKLTYNGPNITDVVCETSDGSPAIEDCVHAFGSLKSSPSLGALHGKKGGTWWAGYVHSCALAIYYQEDWSNDCKATLKDVDDHAGAIFEKCQNPGNRKVGGKVAFVKDKCKAQIEIIKTAGEPPQGDS